MRYLLTVMCAALCLTANAWSVSAYDDVPLDHWAYQVLDYLTEQDILEGYPDGFFNGERTRIRYEFAQAVARLADTVGDGINDAPIQALSDFLSYEFKDQLSQVTCVSVPEGYGSYEEYALAEFEINKYKHANHDYLTRLRENNADPKHNLALFCCISDQSCPGHTPKQDNVRNNDQLPIPAELDELLCDMEEKHFGAGFVLYCNSYYQISSLETSALGFSSQMHLVDEPYFYRFPIDYNDLLLAILDNWDSCHGWKYEYAMTTAFWDRVTQISESTSRGAAKP